MRLGMFFWQRLSRIPVMLTCMSDTCQQSLHGDEPVLRELRSGLTSFKFGDASLPFGHSSELQIKLIFLVFKLQPRFSI